MISSKIFKDLSFSPDDKNNPALMYFSDIKLFCFFSKIFFVIRKVEIISKNMKESNTFNLFSLIKKSILSLNSFQLFYSRKYIFLQILDKIRLNLTYRLLQEFGRHNLWKILFQ